MTPTLPPHVRRAITKWIGALLVFGLSNAAMALDIWTPSMVGCAAPPITPFPLLGMSATTAPTTGTPPTDRRSNGSV
jgi:hypothetical protein